MEIICAWCGKKLGEKPPYEDKEVTHGICEECYKKIRPLNLKDWGYLFTFGSNGDVYAKGNQRVMIDRNSKQVIIRYEAEQCLAQETTFD